jgi:outer membrane protein W
MKKLLISLFLASGLAASAQTLVTGLDVGYLLDSEEAYTTGRLGWQFKANETYTHQLELEVGYTETTEAGGSADLLPVTVNYRLQGTTSGAFGYYFGVGAGFARLGVDGVSTGGSVRLRDTSFAAQGFAGITYQASPAVTLSLGAKYLWIDDVTLASTSFEVGDDIALSAGISIRF